jgi:hypothetical protein
MIDPRVPLNFRNREYCKKTHSTLHIRIIRLPVIQSLRVPKGTVIKVIVIYTQRPIESDNII